MRQKIKDLLGSVRMLNENNRYLKELLHSQVFASTICESAWLKKKNFSPGGGWAVDFAVLYTLYRVLNDVQPQHVLEFGLGQSSKMIHQYANFFKNATAETVEHDSNWVNFFKAGLGDEDYPVTIRLRDLEKIQHKGYETLSYRDVKSVLAADKYNLIIVDAPFGSEHFSRSQVLGLVPDRLGSDFCIVIDDYNRPGEKETFKEICDMLAVNKISYHSTVYSGLKDHALVCSSNWKFLTSL